MKKIRNNKRVLFSILFLFIILICAEIIYTYTITRQFKECTKVITIADIESVQGYYLDDDTFKPQNDDPQILIGDCKDVVSEIKVNFKEPVKRDIDIELYYSRDTIFSQNKMCRKKIKRFDDSIAFKFNSNKYRYIRLDINGEFKLGNIEMGLKRVIVNNNLKIKLIIICICVDIVLLCLFDFFFKEEILGIIEIIKKKKKLIKNIDINKEEKKKLRIEKVFLFWALIGGLIIGILVPSYQVADEYTHLVMMQEELGLSGYAEDALNNYLSEIEASRIQGNSSEKQKLKQYIDASKIKFSDDLHVTFCPSLKIFRHFAANIGFLLCIIIDLPIFWCLQVAELLSLCFYLLCGYYAIKII
ncbi:MAG: hypothetical protein SOZ71_02565 [Clostridium sp.]|nr:hypothetical protein [Clostridium sp.]